MVDVTMRTGGGLDVTADKPGAIVARAITDIDLVRGAIAGITPDMVFTGYQHPDVLAAWVETDEFKPVFLELTAPGRGPVLLPLELRDNGVLGYCGGRHANGNFPVGLREDIGALSGAGEAAIKAAIKAADVPASAIILERQHDRWEGVRNPFVTASSTASPNIALSFAIEGDFETVLHTRNSKGKRKKARSYRRKLDALGAVKFHFPVAVENAPAFLDRFFALKADRFRELGIADVFADQQSQQAFHTLFGKGSSAHQLHAMTLDDTIIAVIACTHHRGRMTVEFGSFDPQFAEARPGEVLYHNVIEHACGIGIDVFDFGVGDEPYKRRWCDIETTHFDTTIGLTTAGSARAFAQTMRSRAVRAIKSSDRVWNAVKAARKGLARG